MIPGRRGLICQAGSHEQDPVLRKFHYIDKGVIHNKKYALDELIKDDKATISVDELRDLLKDRFFKIILEIVIIEDKTIVIKIREWRDGDDEDELARIVACINQWRSGELVRKEIIKRLIEGRGNSLEILVPLNVTFLF